jgi:hypothetical protein
MTKPQAPPQQPQAEPPPPPRAKSEKKSKADSQKRAASWGPSLFKKWGEAETPDATTPKAAGKASVPPLPGRGGKKPSKPEDPVKKAESLSASTKKQLDQSRNKPLDERKHIFRELQRQLHPDKNPDCPEAAKLAFQHLMESRAEYLSG